MRKWYGSDLDYIESLHLDYNRRSADVIMDPQLRVTVKG